ncbi:MAG TPA: glucose 1-dehydrogenase [Bryobacteraceae bacterium]|jgi:NAD(P)-dependent dehydrogenase (short-subunit alcohol dehydrogenase family)|nr:glucose 1-dehydrogenase [Bryobacteraceae bacterium]
MEFEGKAAIVTGTSGIGKAIAMRLARGGGKVLACGVDEAANHQCEAEAREAGIAIHVQECDVSNPSDVRQAVGWAVSSFGGVDILANAAAIHPFGDVLETDLETWNRCLSVNVTGIFLFAKFSIPEMKKRGGGAIVNLASVQGHACQRGVAAYATSKGAILSLTRALALDHAADNIRVNSISPGSIATPMLERAARIFSPDIPVERVFERFGQAHPLGRVGTPEEVAELAAFLLSSRAGFCTGGDYLIDGGLKAGIAVK